MEFESGRVYKLLCEIFDDLDELLLPYMIDLSIFTHIDNPNLHKHIKQVGIVFYERNPNNKPNKKS